MNPTKRNFYDLETLKSIPIHEVAEAFGVEVKKAGNDYWCKIRDEKTPSCKLYTKTNSFCDFGAGNFGGDTITLTAFLHSCSRTDAIEILAQAFGIQPEQQNSTVRKLPSLRQFAKIGIQADMATKNFDFHIEKYGVEGARQISEKYHMPVEALAEQYPNVYHDMLRSKAVPYVRMLRNAYLLELHRLWAFTVKYGFELPQFDSKFFDCTRNRMTNVQTSERILQQAILDPQKVRFKPNAYDLQADYTAIAHGKLSVELDAPMEYHELKALCKAEGRALSYTELPEDLYDTLSSSLDGHTDAFAAITPYAAFVKGDTVTLAYDAAFTEQMQDLINFNQVEQHAVEEIADMLLQTL